MALVANLVFSGCILPPPRHRVALVVDAMVATGGLYVAVTGGPDPANGGAPGNATIGGIVLLGAVIAAALTAVLAEQHSAAYAHRTRAASAPAPASLPSRSPSTSASLPTAASPSLPPSAPAPSPPPSATTEIPSLPLPPSAPSASQLSASVAPPPPPASTSQLKKQRAAGAISTTSQPELAETRFSIAVDVLAGRDVVGSLARLQSSTGGFALTARAGALRHFGDYSMTSFPVFAGLHYPLGLTGAYLVGELGTMTTRSRWGGQSSTRTTLEGFLGAGLRLDRFDAQCGLHSIGAFVCAVGFDLVVF